MPRYKHVFLDSYPLSNAAIAPINPGATSTETDQCRQWMRDCEASGTLLLVPAIAYYEGVRELYLRQATAKIVRFQRFCLNPNRLVPLTLDHLTEAARLWADLRRAGVPTADRHALDGDAILAAQVLSLNLPVGEYVVVTRNPAHLIRFGLPVEQWENINP